MIEEIYDDIKYNFIIDLNKQDIDVFERAKIIEDYMKDNYLSLSAFCRKTNMPKTTVHGWLQPLKIENPPEDTSNINIYTIHKELKYKMKTTPRIYSQPVDNYLRSAISTLGPFGKRGKIYSPNTKELTLKLQDICNRLLMYIEKWQK